MCSQRPPQPAHAKDRVKHRGLPNITHIPFLTAVKNPALLLRTSQLAGFAGCHESYQMNQTVLIGFLDMYHVYPM